MSVRDSKRFGFKRFLNSDCVRPTWLNKHSTGTDVAIDELMAESFLVDNCVASCAYDDGPK